MVRLLRNTVRGTPGGGEATRAEVAAAGPRRACASDDEEREGKGAEQAVKPPENKGRDGSAAGEDVDACDPERGLERQRRGQVEAVPVRADWMTVGAEDEMPIACDEVAQPVA